MKKCNFILILTLISGLLFSKSLYVAKNEIYSIFYHQSGRQSFFILSHRETIRDKTAYFAIKIPSLDEYLKLEALFKKCTKVYLGYSKNDTVKVLLPQNSKEAFLVKSFSFVFNTR